MNKAFDSKAYLKMAQMESEQQAVIDSITKEIKMYKGVFGKQSHVLTLQDKLNAEKRILKVICQCKNTLY